MEENLEKENNLNVTVDKNRFSSLLVIVWGGLITIGFSIVAFILVSSQTGGVDFSFTVPEINLGGDDNQTDSEEPDTDPRLDQAYKSKGVTHNEDYNREENFLIQQYLTKEITAEQYNQRMKDLAEEYNLILEEESQFTYSAEKLDSFLLINPESITSVLSEDLVLERAEGFMDLYAQYERGEISREQLIQSYKTLSN